MGDLKAVEGGGSGGEKSNPVWWSHPLPWYLVTGPVLCPDLDPCGFDIVSFHKARQERIVVAGTGTCFIA